MKRLTRILRCVDDNLTDGQPLVIVPTQRSATSPEPLRCCAGIGWHSEGCGTLDRWDAGESR